MTNTSAALTVGWDIGGAHVKAAVLDAAGTLIQVIQQPCPLWKGVAQLQLAMAAIIQQLPSQPCQHAITMTGELVDCFDSRQHGVFAIIQTATAHLNDPQLPVFSGAKGLLPADAVGVEDVLGIASANWMASAQLVAQYYPQALFVDIGSTTTDALLIDQHQLQAQGLTDYQRLVSGELLYSGVVRTPVMAVAHRAVFKGQRMGLMLECFATMADVYRLTNDLLPAYDQADTADGADKSLRASAVRLSRMTGYEFADADTADWQAFADYLKQQQLALIEHLCRQQAQRCPSISAMPLVGAGVGRFLVKTVAERLHWPYHDFAEVIPVAPVDMPLNAADCAPAAAVALLAYRQGRYKIVSRC
jgi:probable H4MPT-linked C1 transfer pathway protein